MKRWGLVISLIMAFGVVFPAYAGKFKSKCAQCHSDVVGFLSEGAHRKMDCSKCHGENSEELKSHIKDPSSVRPAVLPLKQGPSFCGSCHKKRYKEYIHVNLESKAKIEKGTPVGRAPAFDLLLHRYGFVFEHAEPRSHIFMLLDHVIVDRAYKGRFRLKSYRDFIPPDGWDGDIRPIIVDGKKTLPWRGKADVNGLSPFAFGAGNRVCLNCKTTDYSVGWETISKGGNKTGFGRFTRAGNRAAAEDIAKGVVRFSINCTHCHDPHMAKMRVIRDALIERLKDRGPYPYDSEKNEKARRYLKLVAFPEVKDNYREVFVWDRNVKDVKLNWLTCAQCHVEYECNPVTDLKTHKKIGFSDPRTNVFPWRNVRDAYRFYTEELGIYTFKHGIAGSPLIKAQHPEVEVWWESRHERAGVDCIDCHMPGGFHSPMSPRSFDLRKTCLKCHKEWSEEEALYVIDSVQEYIRGKMRDAEFHLSRLVNAIAEAERLGVSQEVINNARQLHSKAHLLWEWWTAENSDGFHDPDEAFLTLGEASRLAEKGWKMLEKAMKKKK